MEDKALDNNLTLKRKRIMIYFIEAAEKLIRQNGIENLSIRKIATEAGYNSATIYNYFNETAYNVWLYLLFKRICGPTGERIKTGNAGD